MIGGSFSVIEKSDQLSIFSIGYFKAVKVLSLGRTRGFENWNSRFFVLTGVPFRVTVYNAITIKHAKCSGYKKGDLLVNFSQSVIHPTKLTPQTKLLAHTATVSSRIKFRFGRSRNSGCTSTTNFPGEINFFSFISSRGSKAKMKRLSRCSKQSWTYCTVTGKETTNYCQTL